MENIIVGIVSGDKNFSKALGLSLMAVSDEFIIKAYDTKRFISEWNAFKGEEYNRKFDIILWDGKEMEDTYSGNIIYLAEKASLVRQDFNAGKFSIYKYCGAPAMAAAIFEIYSSLTGRGTVFIRKDKVSLLAFGSWEGGSGCTTVSLAVAQELQRFRNKKVLILSLEAVESTPGYFTCAPQIKSVGEYLYRALPDKSITGEKETPFIESYIVRDLYGVAAFAPSKSRNPLPELNETDMQKLVALLIDSGSYDAVIIDMGTCLNEAAAAVMEMADKICFVTRTERLTKREEMYLSHVLVMTSEETMIKSVRLTNMSRGQLTEDTDGDDKNGRGNFVTTRAKARLFDDAGGAGEPTQLILEGDFGDDIRNLTGVMLKH